MITFTMLVTIWIGGHAHEFHVFTAQRFQGDSACNRAANQVAEYIQFRTASISKARVVVDRGCFTLETRPS
jgi:hypothetical protein